MVKKRLPFFLLLLCFAGFQLSVSGQIIINEINYHSAPDLDSKDWLEFYNSNGSQVNIGNWSFSDDNDANLFTFPAGTTIPGNGYLVLVRNIDTFLLVWPEVVNYIGEFDFGLNNGGELLRLYNATGALVDTVHFDDEAPWPTDPDGLGPTLQLSAPGLDNALASSWFSGAGTPGAPNVTSKINAPFLSVHFQIFPNPVTHSATLKIDGDLPSNSGKILFFNILGDNVLTLPFHGEQEILIQDMPLAPGLYTMQLMNQSHQVSEAVKFIVAE